MSKKSLLINSQRYYRQLLCFICIMIFSCAPSGMIIDRAQFETPVQKMHLLNYPYFKIYHGGVLQEIPLKQVQLIKINPASSILYDNELYYGAELVLKNGTKIQSSKDKLNSPSVFVSIENALEGVSKAQKFSITIDNIRQLQVKK